MPIVPASRQDVLQGVQAPGLGVHEVPGPRQDVVILVEVTILDNEVVLPDVVPHAFEVSLDGVHHLLIIVHPTEFTACTAIGAPAT